MSFGFPYCCAESSSRNLPRICLLSCCFFNLRFSKGMPSILLFLILGFPEGMPPNLLYIFSHSRRVSLLSCWIFRIPYGGGPSILLSYSRIPLRYASYPAVDASFPAVSSKVGVVLKKVSIEAIPMFYYLGKVSIKRLYRVKSQKFSAFAYLILRFSKGMSPNLPYLFLDSLRTCFQPCCIFFSDSL